MSEHTPGPWEWDGTPWDYDNENEAPFLMQAPFQKAGSKGILQGTIHCRTKADAYLIAAAPELLEALELSSTILEAAYNFGLQVVYDGKKELDTMAALFEIRAAITKTRVTNV